MASVASSTPNITFNFYPYSNERRDDVIAICKNVLKPLYGSQSELLSQVDKGDLGCRILRVAKEVVGLLVYERDLRPIQENGNQRGLMVRVCCLNTEKSDHKQRCAGVLIEKALTKAQESKAPTIVIPVHPSMKELISSLQLKGFRQINSAVASSSSQGPSTTQVFFSYAFQAPISEQKPSIFEKGTVVNLPLTGDGAKVAAHATSNLGKKHNSSASSERKERPIDTVTPSPVNYATSSRNYSFNYSQRDSRGDSKEERVDNHSYLGKRGRDERGDSNRYSPYESAKRVKGESGQAERFRSHEVTLKKQYIHMIRNGSKTIEGRINSGMFKAMREGDKVHFFYKQNMNDDVVCRIKRITPYKSFADMLKAEGYKKCIPDVFNIESAIRVYDEIPGFSERARQNGVLAIVIEVIPKESR